MKKLLLSALFALIATQAWAQNPQCPTRPLGDSSNACASTAFVQGTVQGQIFNVKNYNASGSSQETTGTIAAGSKTLALAAAKDFKNGQGVLVNHAGTAFTVAAPTSLTVTPKGATGAVTYAYRIASYNYTGGVGAAIAPISIANGNATLTSTNHNLLEWTCAAGNTTGYAVWRSVSSATYTLIGFVSGLCKFKDQGGTPGVVDDGASTFVNEVPVATAPLGTTRPFWIPDLPPTSALANWLVTTVTSGGGGTNLVLSVAATTAVTAEAVLHDDTAAISTAVAASAGSNLYFPAGNYSVSDEFTINTARSAITGDGVTTNIEQRQYGKAIFKILSADFVVMQNWSCTNLAPKVSLNTSTEFYYYGEPWRTRHACIFVNDSESFIVNGLTSYKFIQTVSALGRPRVQNTTTGTGTGTTMPLNAADAATIAAWPTASAGSPWRLWYSDGAGNGGTWLTVTGYNSGTNTVTFTPSQTFSWGNVFYAIAQSGYDNNNQVLNSFTQSNDYSILFVLQDRFNVTNLRNINGERTQYIGTSHAVYGTGDGVVYGNGYLSASNITDWNSDGHTIKYRGTGIEINGVFAQSVRFGLSLEQLTYGTVNSVNIIEAGGNAWNYANGTAVPTDAIGAYLVDSSNVEINGLYTTISALYGGTTGAQRFSCAQITATKQNPVNISINNPFCVSNADTNSGFGIWVDSTDAGVHAVSRVFVRGMVLVNLGSVAIQGAYFVHGTGHQFLYPSVRDASAGGTNYVVDFETTASDSIARLDPKLLTYGFVVRDAGTNNTITYDAHYNTGSAWALGVSVNPVTGVVTIPISLGLGTSLSPVNGGTGLSSYAQGDMIYASATNVLSKLAKNTTATRYLSNTGTNNDPAWALVNLGNGVTGSLTVPNGGTGQVALTTNGILYGNDVSPVQVTAAAASSVLITSGANVPSLSTTLPSGVQDNITRTGTVVSGTWNGTKLGLAFGGTNADLSATGGASQFLKQNSSGAAITVVRPTCSDLSDATAWCSGSVSLAAITPTVTCSTGDPTGSSTSGSAFLQIGKMVYFSVALSVVIATCVGELRVALPNSTTANRTIILFGDNETTGGPALGRIPSGQQYMQVFENTRTIPITLSSYSISGWYEAQ